MASPQSYVRPEAIYDSNGNVMGYRDTNTRGPGYGVSSTPTPSTPPPVPVYDANGNLMNGITPNTPTPATPTPTIATSNREYGDYIDSLGAVDERNPMAEFAPPQINMPAYSKIPYGQVITPQKIAYTPSFNQDYWNELGKNTMAQLQANLQPGYEKAIRTTQEEATNRVGPRSGLVSEALRPVNEAYQQELGKGAMAFQSAELQAKIADYTAKAEWDRKEQARVLGETFAQELEARKYERDQNFQEQTWNLDKALQEGKINRENYFEVWNRYNDNRLMAIKNARDSIVMELQLAAESKNFEKEKALRLQLKQMDIEEARAQREAASKGAVWGAIGSAFGMVGSLATAGILGGKKPQGEGGV